VLKHFNPVLFAYNPAKKSPAHDIGMISHYPAYASLTILSNFTTVALVQLISVGTVSWLYGEWSRIFGQGMQIRRVKSFT